MYCNTYICNIHGEIYDNIIGINTTTGNIYICPYHYHSFICALFCLFVALHTTSCGVGAYLTYIYTYLIPQ